MFRIKGFLMGSKGPEVQNVDNIPQTEQIF